MEYNLCGNVCAEGKIDPSRQRLVGAVDRNRPDLIFLNETCYSQYRALRNSLLARGYQATYSSTTTGGKCDNDDSRHGPGFGNAIFSKGHVPTARQVYDLGGSDVSPGGVRRTYQLLCTDTTLNGRGTKACVTHLHADNEAARTVQGKRVAAKAKYWASRKPTVIAGDLNETPKDSSPGLNYGHGGGAGDFQEADENDTAYRSQWPARASRGRAGEPTFHGGTKIDFLFLSDEHFMSVSGDVKSRSFNPISDHGLYVGTAKWQ